MTLSEGYLLYQFHRAFSRLVGIEYSAQRHAQAQANLAGSPYIPILDSVEDMPQIESNSMDRIVSPT